MDFHQEYIPHEYLELKMPAGQDAEGKPSFLLDPNHLHIWPRHSFMLIALPNKVGILALVSVVLTTPHDLRVFFRTDHSHVHCSHQQKSLIV